MEVHDDVATEDDIYFGSEFYCGGDILVAEGQPVTAGDLIARLNARGAIQAAANSLEADFNLVNAQREFERFPARKQLMERQDSYAKQMNYQ